MLHHVDCMDLSIGCHAALILITYAMKRLVNLREDGHFASNQWHL